MAKLQRAQSTAVLNEDQVDEFKEAFELFDQSKQGSIDKETLKAVVSQFGVRASAKELDEMFAEADLSGKGKFGFPEFMSMMGKRMKQTSSEAQLLRAFKVFDETDDGYIPSADLVRDLSTLGDKLTKKEVGELLAVCENDKQQIKYNMFVDMMFAKK